MLLEMLAEDRLQLRCGYGQCHPPAIGVASCIGFSVRRQPFQSTTERKKTCKHLSLILRCAAPFLDDRNGSYTREFLCGLCRRFGRFPSVATDISWHNRKRQPIRKKDKMEHVRWSMVNACTPQGEPILGTGGEKKKLDYVHSHLAKRVEIFKKCSPVMVAFRLLQPWSQTFVSTESLDLMVPGVRSPS